MNTMSTKGFVLLSEAVPEAIQEIRYHSAYNFVGTRIDGYLDPIAVMTANTGKALKEASDEFLSMGLRIRVYDAYRPQQAVSHFVRWAQDSDDIKMKEIFYPSFEKPELFEKDFIAVKSGHSRGSAVDLTLMNDRTGLNLDMGGVFDQFEACSGAYYTEGLTEEQINNRKQLREVMCRHGFEPTESEWWHFGFINEEFPDTYFSFPVSAAYFR